MIGCVYRIISCVRGHISGMSSIMLPIYRWMLPGNMLQQRFHFDLIGCTSRAVLKQRHHHHCDDHHPRSIGCHWHWTAMLPFMAHRRCFCANARFLQHFSGLLFPLSAFALLSFSHSAKQTNKIVIINRAEKRTERSREREEGGIHFHSLVKIKKHFTHSPLRPLTFSTRRKSEIVLKCCWNLFQIVISLNAHSFN